MVFPLKNFPRKQTLIGKGGNSGGGGGAYIINKTLNNLLTVKVPICSNLLLKYKLKFSSKSLVTPWSPYEHLQSILEHSGSLKHNYFGSVTSWLHDLIKCTRKFHGM